MRAADDRRGLWRRSGEVAIEVKDGVEGDEPFRLAEVQQLELIGVEAHGYVPNTAPRQLGERAGQQAGPHVGSIGTGRDYDRSHRTSIDSEGVRLPAAWPGHYEPTGRRAIDEPEVLRVRESRLECGEEVRGQGRVIELAVVVVRTTRILGRELREIFIIVNEMTRARSHGRLACARSAACHAAHGWGHMP